MKNRYNFIFIFYTLHIITFGSISVSNLFLALALITLFYRRDKDLHSPLNWLIGGFILTSVLSSLFSIEPFSAIGTLGEIFLFASLMIPIYSRFSQKMFYTVLDYLTVVATLFSIPAIFNLLYSVPERVKGPLSHYMTFAGILMLVAVANVTRLSFENIGGRKKIVFYISVAIIFCALFATLTRAAWVGLLAGILPLLRKKRISFLPLTLLLIITTGVIYLNEEVKGRFFSFFNVYDLTFYDRLAMIDAALLFIKDNPVFGVGVNMVDDFYPVYRHPFSVEIVVPHLHNAFLQIAAERGLIALFFYLLLLLYIIYYSLKSKKSVPIAFTTTIAFVVAGLFEDNFGDTEVQRIWFFLASLPFITEYEKERENRQNLSG